MADIFNTASNTLLSGTSENDSIYNDLGDKVTIDSGDGDDSIRNRGGQKVSIDAGKGNDSIFNNGDKVTIKAGAGDDEILNDGGWRVSISGGSGNDSILNRGWEATIEAGDGNDFITNTGSSVQVHGNTGNDSIESNGFNVTINAGNGDDQISLKSSGNSIYYSALGGNDTIFGFNESDTLRISGGKYSTQKSGSDVLVQVGTGSILLKDAADKKLSINEYRTTKLITLTKNSDEFKNNLINVAIQGLGGHDSIINDRRSNCVTINGDAGNDLLYTYESDRVTLLGGAGNDSLFNGNNAFSDELSYENGGDQVFMDGGKGNDKIGNNSDHSVTVNGGAGDDYIFTFSGEKISINAGAGNDTIDIDSYEGGLTLKGGAGSDLFLYYAEGDEDVKVSNDIITDYEEEDTIKFDELSDSTVSSITTNDSGHVIFKVGRNKLVVKNAADKVVTYIDSDGSTKTFGQASTNPKFITLTEGDDTYSNSLEGATINALGGNDSIENYGSNVSILGGAGDDSIENYKGDNVKIFGGEGNDSIISSRKIGFSSSTLTVDGGAGDDYIAILGGEKISINGGVGNDSIFNHTNKVLITGGTGDDSIKNWSHWVTIDAGDGNDSIYNNDGDNLSINGGTGNDYIENTSGDNVTVDAGAGDDRIINDWVEGGALQVSIDGGSGNDYIGNWSDGAVKINGGDGNDTIYTNVTYGGNVLTGGAGADLFDYQATAYEDDNEQAVSNDTITDYAEEDTIQFNKKIKKVSTNSAGSVVFTFAEVKNKLVVKNAADKVVTYIDADGTKKTFGGSSADEWQLDGTTATYGSLTVKGVTSLDGLSLSGKIITVSASSLGTEKISVSNGYKLALGSDVSGSTTKKSWTLKNSTATYKQTTSAGYSLVGNEIIYSKKSSKTLATVKGVTSTDGLSVQKKIVTVSASSLGTEKISVSDGYTLALDSDVSGSTTKKSWTLKNSTATYKQTTSAGYSLDGNEIIYSKKSSKTLATVKGVTSTDGLSVQKKIVTVSANSLGTEKISVSDGYTLALDSDVSGSTTKKSWTLKNSTATYKQTTGEGYTLEDNTIVYSKKATKTLATVKGVTSTDGLSVQKKIVTVSANSLGMEKISVSDGYTLALGDDVSSPTTKKSWTLKNSTATYNQTTTAGYSLVGNEIIYSKKSSKTLAKVTGVTSLDGLKVSGKTIKLSGDSLSKKVSISGAYTFDFASDFKNATVTGSSSNDTIIARGKNIFVRGGGGSDVFALKSTGTVGDYDSEDKISLSSAAEISTDGSDLIFNAKVTVSGGAEKSVTYLDADGQHTIEPAAKNFILSADGKSIALTDTYLDDDFDVADFGAAIQTIDASAVVHELKITGNKLANVITATAEDDYVDGGAGSDKIFGGESNDTLVGGKGNDLLVGGSGDDSLWGGTGSDSLNGGDGSDTFVYKSGDGSIIIEDFDDAWDKIRVLSGDVNPPTVDKAGDVTFAVDDGQIIVKGGANKYIPIYDEGKNILMKHSPK